MTIRIGFDARMIYHSGIGTFIYNFLERVAGSSDYEFVLFGDPAALHRYPNVIEPFIRGIYTISEQVYWPGAYKKHSLDILHLPHYNFPLFYKGRMIIHVHDIIHLLFPQFLPNKLAYYYAKFFLNQVVLKADRIIVNSMATKNDLIKKLSADPTKIRVVYYAVASEFQQYSDRMRNEKQYIFERYNLPEKYILYLGNIRLLKNIPNLLSAYRAFQRRTGSDYHLVLAGRNFLPDWYIKTNTHEKIHFIGEVEKEDLPAIYNFAAIFVFPSLYEGFGLPVLEAMSCGVPVICSKSGSLGEISGGAAYAVDENDTRSISEGIEKLLSDPQLKHKFRRNGLKNVKKYSWDKTVQDINRIYNEI